MNTTPILDEPSMRALGFTDHREGYWYWSALMAEAFEHDEGDNDE